MSDNGLSFSECKELVGRYNVAQCLTNVAGKFASEGYVDMTLVCACAYELGL